MSRLGAGLDKVFQIGMTNNTVPSRYDNHCNNNSDDTTYFVKPHTVNAVFLSRVNTV